MPRNFRDFMAAYAPPERPIVEVNATPQGDPALSPFILIRHGRYTAVVNPIGMADGTLDIDVHSFADGEDATAGVFGMSEGHRFPGLNGTGSTSAGWPSTHLIVLLVGEQGQEG